MEHVCSALAPSPAPNRRWVREGGSIFAEEKDAMLQILADRRKAGGFSPRPVFISTDRRSARASLTPRCYILIHWQAIIFGDSGKTQ